MSGQQNALERDSGGLGETPEPAKDVGINGNFGPAHLFRTAGAHFFRPARERLQITISEFILPKAPRFFGGKGFSFESNEIAVSDPRWDNGFAATFEQRGIVLEDFGHNGGQAPAVEADVMEADDELECFGALELDVEANEGSSSAVESFPLFELNPADEFFLLS